MTRPGRRAPAAFPWNLAAFLLVSPSEELLRMSDTLNLKETIESLRARIESIRDSL